ncbi:hypothetical protein Btru_042226 [Bulinus truncatus]|nr:hypothetical protein Btru_042226 [Bulinus truncatus]
MKSLVTSLIGICIYLIGCSHCGKFCVSHPDLYYANVNGLIAGGYDTMLQANQQPCPKDPETLRYREIDGRCNHPKDYGSAGKPFKRYMRAHYQDEQGINTPRIYSVVGNNYLPSPRYISSTLFPDVSQPSNLSMFTMEFGQFLSHDIEVAPVPTGPNGTITCCDQYKDGNQVEYLPQYSTQNRRKRMNENCFPIPVPADDTRFSTCMEFVRSEAARDKNGNQIYPREQINGVTSFLDLSAIYGSNIETTKLIRAQNGTGALLKTTLVNGHERLPNDTSARPSCLRTKSPTSYCQKSGDARVNQNPALGTQHLLFHLYHNFVVRELVAGILKRKGVDASPAAVEQYIEYAPNALKETLFQEARRILGAIFQKISYCDYLPFIVGRDLMEKYKLGCSRRSKYNPYVNPSIANSFIAAAYRFGHTLIPNAYEVNGEDEFFKDEFFIPDSSIDNHEEIIAGMLNSTKEVNFDRYFAKGITEHLFETKTGPKKALDLVSLNLQRGRDHGLPAYFYWRRFFGLGPMYSGDGYDEDCKLLMSNMYQSLLDVDLYAGGICEGKVPGGSVGETFGNIIAYQFSELKYGDRFFFLHKGGKQTFTDEQVAAILDVSTNALLCFSGKLSYVQGNTWFRPSDRNPMIPCSEFSQIDVSLWIDYFFDNNYVY